MQGATIDEDHRNPRRPRQAKTAAKERAQEGRQRQMKRFVIRYTEETGAVQRVQLSD
jgi:hypothetical protein